MKRWDGRKGGKMGERARDEVSKRVMEMFQLRFLFVLQIAPLIPRCHGIEVIDGR